jgi:hypothetical protein
MNKHRQGKVIPILLVILLLMAAAFAAGYYISWLQFNKKTERLTRDFYAFEGKYEKTLSSLRSNIMDIQTYIEEKEGKTKAETQKLRLMSILLKAKGEIISSKLALSRGDVDQSLQSLNDSIAVLKDAYEMETADKKDRIEEIRLQLATAKGLIRVDVEKAQQELDALWRKIDGILN